MRGENRYVKKRLAPSNWTKSAKTQHPKESKTAMGCWLQYTNKKPKIKFSPTTRITNPPHISVELAFAIHNHTGGWQYHQYWLRGGHPPILHSGYCILSDLSDMSIFCARQFWLVGTIQNSECKYLGKYFDSHDMFWCVLVGRASSIYLAPGLGDAATRGESDFAPMQGVV